MQAVQAAVLAVLVRVDPVALGHPGKATLVGPSHLALLHPLAEAVAVALGQLARMAFLPSPVMAGPVKRARSPDLLCCMAAAAVVAITGCQRFRASLALAEVVAAQGLETALMVRMALAVEGVASDTPDKGAAEDLGL
jgi:hypothetical protein